MHRVAKTLLILASLFSTVALGQSHVSSYVSMDDWVYPALDRMIARGELSIEGTGIRPWTRMQIAFLLQHCRRCEGPDFDALRSEFTDTPDRKEVRLDSIYIRSEQIAGTPLTNGFDYGQTVVNDFGRPNREGQNIVAGLEARSESRWMTSAIRLEYQQSGTDSLDAHQLVAWLDGAATAAQWSPASVKQVRIIEGYVGTRIANLSVTVGKQVVHWGRGYSGGILMGENAEPLNMLRIRNANSLTMPWIFAKMGKWSGEFFVGKLGGHLEPFNPWLQGQKLIIAVTPNLEFGFSRTIVFAGGGRGLATSFVRSFLSVGNNMSTTPGTPADVGDRRAGLDFQYRFPKLRKLVTLYADSFSDDDPSPLAAPHRAAFLSGIYLPQLPKLKKVDLRLESAFTDSPGVRSDGRFFYANGGYAQSYTNNGQLLGHWVGRAGKAYQGFATYWFSPTTKAQVNVRALQLSSRYLPGGGRQWDFAGTYESTLRKNVEIRVAVQGERWLIPALKPGPQANLSLSFRVTYHTPWVVAGN